MFKNGVIAAFLLVGIASASRIEAQVTADPAARSTTGFVLRAGDVLKVKIWREPDLSGDFKVDEAGRVNLPLAGTQLVAGRTRDELERRLTSAYSASVQNLSMNILILRPIPVVGAVRTPGLFLIEPTMTVGDAIATAGGSVQDLSRTKVQIVRGGAVLVENVNPATTIAALPLEPGDQVYIPPASGFFTRNPWAAATIIQSLVTIITTLAVVRN